MVRLTSYVRYELHAIAAYPKRGLKPVVNEVPDSEGPPDSWAGAMVPADIGEYPAPPFPTANEVEAAPQDRERVLHGRCFVDPNAPCFHGRAKNLTPDEETGIGRSTDRQTFSALRYGLRPEDTPDVDITGMTPGKGNFPAEPHYLGPFMPWASARYMSDDDLRAIIAYLRHVKPVHNDVAMSDDVPDHWAGVVETLGTCPPPPFPTANEVGGQ